MMLASIGAAQTNAINTEDFFKNPSILEEDIKELINFFIPRDISVKIKILTSLPKTIIFIFSTLKYQNNFK